MSNCPQCQTERVEKSSPSGNRPYRYCPNCVAFNQQVYLHRKMTDAQLDEKEISSKENLKRTLAAIKAVRKERRKL